MKTLKRTFMSITPQTKGKMIIHKTRNIPCSFRKVEHSSRLTLARGYLCNGAIGIGNDYKMSFRWNKVTCKNCLKHKANKSYMRCK